MALTSLLFPFSSSVPRVDGRRAVNDIISQIEQGLQWKDKPVGAVYTRRSTTASSTKRKTS